MDAISRRTFLEAVGVGVMAAACAPMGTQKPVTVASEAEDTSDLLSGQWMMQSSAVATAAGDEISVVGAATAGWVAVKVPSTVMAGLIAHGEYPDVFYGDNLKQVQK